MTAPTAKDLTASMPEPLLGLKLPRAIAVPMTNVLALSDQTTPTAKLGAIPIRRVPLGYKPAESQFGRVIHLLTALGTSHPADHTSADTQRCSVGGSNVPNGHPSRDSQPCPAVGAQTTPLINVEPSTKVVTSAGPNFHGGHPNFHGGHPIPATQRLIAAVDSTPGVGHA